MNLSLYVPFIGIVRHRLSIDGEGVITLAAFHGCPLDCRFCLNPQCKEKVESCKIWHTPRSLYEEIRVDELYFLATNGGVSFGGGEPLLYPDFIAEFRKCCGSDWCITVETSLNVPVEMLLKLIPVVDRWIIDIKDMNPEIYFRYTRRNNDLVMINLKELVNNSMEDDCLIRLPEIPGYNTLKDIAKSERQLRDMGFYQFNQFKYVRNVKGKAYMQDTERNPSADCGGE